MNKLLCLALGAALSMSAPLAGAVVLNPHGLGQVLVYPYFTVNAGFGTLFSVVNTTANGKALKIHFREGYNGRDVLYLNLYLSPFDVWVGQIFDTSADGTGAAAVATNDNSCTVPELTNVHGPNPGQGPRAEPFREFAYSGANSDGGPSGLSRTHEGYFEIIEMGEVTGQSLLAIEHDSTGVPSDCNRIVQAWTADGYWTANPQTDLAPPAGGLYGAESIIDVAEGTMYTVNAEAIDGFSNVAQHTSSTNAAPDLSAASKSAAGTVSAFVPVGGGMVEAIYENPADAVSALFMVDGLFNDYVVDPAIGATSDWIVTFPTKRFYTDPALLAGAQQARLPFDALFVGATGGSGTAFNLQLANREEQEALSTCNFFTCPPPGEYWFYYATNAIGFATSGSVLGSHLQVTPTTPVAQNYGFSAGHARVDLTRDVDGSSIPNHALSSSNGITFTGLPATGFLAVNYVNANVTPGVLSNYSGANAHRAHATCTRSTSPQTPCP